MRTKDNYHPNAKETKVKLGTNQENKIIKLKPNLLSKCKYNKMLQNGALEQLQLIPSTKHSI